MENDEMTNDAAVAWSVPGAFDPTTRRHSWVDVWTHRREPFTEPLYSATTVAELRAEVIKERERADKFMWQVRDTCARAEAAERRVAECLKFIAGVRDELHNRRTADWYPEGAHNAAEQMSEDMRLIGNACADFDPYTLRQEKPE